MSALAEAVEVAAQEVSRSPQSPRAFETITELIRHIDEFLVSPELETAGRLGFQEDRAAIAEMVSKNAQRVSEDLHEMLSVAVQIEELGGQTPWGGALADAVARLEHAFARLGVSVDPSKRPPPIVIRDRASTGAVPSFLIANVPRRPQLEPYIALALQSARVRELEPGRWYADLDAFPGVWADGTSPEECLTTVADVLHEWLVIKLAHGDRDIPVIGNLDPTTLALA